MKGTNAMTMKTVVVKMWTESGGSVEKVQS